MPIHTIGPDEYQPIGGDIHLGSRSIRIKYASLTELCRDLAQGIIASENGEEYNLDDLSNAVRYSLATDIAALAGRQYGRYFQGGKEIRIREVTSTINGLEGLFDIILSRSIILGEGRMRTFEKGDHDFNRVMQEIFRELEARRGYADTAPDTFWDNPLLDTSIGTSPDNDQRRRDTGERSTLFDDLADARDPHTEVIRDGEPLRILGHLFQMGGQNEGAANDATYDRTKKGTAGVTTATKKEEARKELPKEKNLPREVFIGTSGIDANTEFPTYHEIASALAVIREHGAVHKKILNEEVVKFRNLLQRAYGGNVRSILQKNNLTTRMVATILREDAANDPVYLDPQKILELQLTGYHSFQLRDYRVQTGTGHIIAQVAYR